LTRHGRAAAGKADVGPEPTLASRARLPKSPSRGWNFFRRLAENRPVVFHGSPRGDLTELSTERRSTDTTAFGNQQAV
jgi:hypothetical protein